jgi:hypothetical protein
MADTPLRPNQVILDSILGLPTFKADVEDISHPRLALQNVCELGDGFDNVHLFSHLGEKSFSDSADTVGLQND